jgi:hypothetical protein
VVAAGAIAAELVLAPMFTMHIGAVAAEVMR